MTLSPKQQRFVEEYLLDLNATAAYQRAGYKATGNAAESAAARLLRNVQVQAAIQTKQAERSQRTQVTADFVVRELALVASQRAHHLYRPDGTIKPPSEWDDALSASIAGVEVFEEFEGHGDGREQIGITQKVKRWDKVQALRLLGLHLGLFVERRKHEGTGPNGEIEHKHSHDLLSRIDQYTAAFTELANRPEDCEGEGSPPGNGSRESSDPGPVQGTPV